ncbi:MAG: hypothetical protein ACYDCA_09530 [Candidatus Tyrphobacter sp.]
MGSAVAEPFEEHYEFSGPNGTLSESSLELALLRVTLEDGSDRRIQILGRYRDVGGSGAAWAALGAHMSRLPSHEVRPFDERLGKALGIA